MTNLVELLRIKHWIKNFFVFAPIIFAIKLTDIKLFASTFFVFIVFCLTSSVVYIFNDLFDRKQDRKHPRKKDRPIASGDVSTKKAISVVIVLLSIIAIFFVSDFSLKLLLIILLYFFINVIYTLYAKSLEIVDVFFLSSGFLLRIFAGSFAIGVFPTNWILMTVFFISLFLGFSKRKSELFVLDKKNQNSFRSVLSKYNHTTIDIFLFISATLTMLSYSLYTIDTITIQKLETDYLVYTVPFVLFGIFRYLFLLFGKMQTLEPVEIVLTDRQLQITILLWLLVVVFVLLI